MKPLNVRAQVAQFWDTNYFNISIIILHESSFSGEPNRVDKDKECDIDKL